MHTIEAKFHRLSDLPVAELFGAMGVYVLWTPDAWSKPSYIGEGNLFRRLSGHLDEWLGRRGDGVVSIMGYTSERYAKLDAETVEATLLESAQMLGMWPGRNRQGAKTGAMWSRGARGGHNVFRVKFSGAHPLHYGNRIQGSAELKWRWTDQERWALDSPPWRAR